MKQIIYMSFFLFMLLYNGCRVVEYKCVDGITQSQALYAKNISGEPIFVQSFYRPFDTADGDTLWCEKEPIVWSEIILLDTGERKLIMDYVKPACLKIYRYADTGLLLDVPDVYEYISANDAVIKYSDSEISDIGCHLQEKGMCINAKSYYLKNDRYLFENIPWKYPVRFDNYNCERWDKATLKTLLEDRQTSYANEANGYALLFCITINTDNL
jgi:hypothetical protein